MKRLLWCTLFISLWFSPAHARKSGTPLLIGQRRVVHSSILGEDRPVYVALPYDYGNGRRHPVLIVTDGRSSFLPAVSVADFLAKASRIPSLIVVAIPNTARNRDFTPIPVPDRPGTGHADRFLAFLAKELLPWLDKTYRTAPFRIFAGHSLCGMFACHLAAVRPGLFQGIIAMSPALPYGNGIVIAEWRKRLTVPFPVPLRLFLSVGNEPRYLPALEELTAMLTGENGTGITLKYRQYPDLTHGTVLLKSLYDGLEHVCYDWPPPPDSSDMTVEALEAHYRALTAVYGFPVPPPEPVLNRLGYRMLRSGQIAEALRVMKAMVGYYPESANASDSYGEALEKAGRLQPAAAAYRNAIRIGKRSRDPNLPLYRSHLSRVNSRIASKK